MATVELIKGIASFKESIPLIEGHHEWYNGDGYPNKLKGAAIPLGARILAVADAYEAMTHPRPYRPSLDKEEATRALRKGSGKQWDPEIVDAFLGILEREPTVLEALLAGM